MGCVRVMRDLIFKLVSLHLLRYFLNVRTVQEVIVEVRILNCLLNLHRISNVLIAWHLPFLFDCRSSMRSFK